MFVLAACGLAFALICQYYASKCAYGFGTALRRALYRHVNTLSHSAVDRIGTASLITRITSDTNTVQSGLNMMIRLATRCPFLIIGAAGHGNAYRPETFYYLSDCHSGDRRAAVQRDLLDDSTLRREPGQAGQHRTAYPGKSGRRACHPCLFPAG